MVIINKTRTKNGSRIKTLEEKIVAIIVPYLLEIFIKQVSFIFS